MQLPTPATLTASKFPETAEQASQIFRVAASDSGSPPAPLPEHYLSLLSVLLETPHGARGLFVSLLSDPGVTLADKEAEAGSAVAADEGRSSPLDAGFVAILTATARLDDALNDEGKMTQARYVRHLSILNVVMPAAMVVVHDTEEKRQMSAVTRDRAKRVLREWYAAEKKAVGEGSAAVHLELAREMNKSLMGEGSEYAGFLEKWGYDVAQKGAMAQALRQVFGNEL